MSWQSQVTAQLVAIQNWISNVQTKVKAIWELTTASTIGTSDYIPISIGGVTYKISLLTLLNFINNNTTTIENRYDVSPDNDIDAMLADQANQTSGKLQYVEDASDDPNIDSGYAYYEYLGGGNASLSDYRLLNDLETQLIQVSENYKTLKLIEKTTGSYTSVIDGGLSISYTGSDITEIYFNKDYSKLVSAVASELSGRNFVLQLVNKSTGYKFLTDVSSANIVNVVYYKIAIPTGLDPDNFTVGDVIEVEMIPNNNAESGGGGDLLAANNGSDFDDIPTVRTNLGLEIGTDVQGVLAEGPFVDGDKTKLDALSNAEPPIDETYANITALIAAQNDQLDDWLYKVTDASDHTDINSGAAIFQYLGTTVGDETDYELVWQETPNPVTEYISVFGSDLDTPLEVGEKELMFCLFDFTLVTYWPGALTQVPTGAALTVDLKKNGVSITSTPASIDAGEATSLTGTAPVLTTTSFSKGDIISRNITSIGSTDAGKGLQIVLEIIKT